MDLVLISFSKHELQEMIRSSLWEVIRSTPHTIASGKKNYLSVGDAAAFLQIPKSTLYTYTSKRLIPHYKRGKRLVFKQSDLEEWLSESKKKTVSEIESEVQNSQSKRGGKK